MQEVTDRPRVAPEDVGQHRATEGDNRPGFGGFLRANILTWMVVIALAAIFAIAIVVAA